MVRVDISKLDETQKKVVSILERNGPSLPVRIAREASISSLFAGAYLSELANSGIIKISKMKVGSSPLYLLPDQEEQLEKFISYLNERERQACLLLKKHNILEDEKQMPAIRVALRSLKDFAIPIQKQGKIIWKYFLYKEQEKEIQTNPIQLQPISEEAIQKSIPIKKPRMTSEELKQKAEQEIESQIFKEEEELSEEDRLKEIQEKLLAKEQELEKIKQKIKKKTKSKKISTAKDKFLEQVKQSFSQKNIELLDILSYDKKYILAKINNKGKDCLIFIYNKKKINDTDIIKAYKKAGQPFIISSKADLSKKLLDSIEAFKNLLGFERID